MNAYNAYSAIDLCNQAFRALGEQPITSFTDASNPRALLAQQFYAQVRDTLLGEHFWNFATVRTTLYPYTTPATTLAPAAPTGPGVLFTAGATDVFSLEAVGQGLTGVGVPGSARISALVSSTPAATLTPGAGASVVEASVPFSASASVFTAADIGHTIVGPPDSPLSNLPGLARIVAVPSGTQALGLIWQPFAPGVAIPPGQWKVVKSDRVLADISSAFSGAVLPAGSWQLTDTPPPWGFAYRVRVPVDMIAMQRVQDSAEYQRESDWFLTNAPALSLTYTSATTNLRSWPPFFVSAFVAALTAAFAEQITGQQAKHQLWHQLAEARLKRAKLHDGQEGSAPQVISPTLIRARYGGWRGAGWR